MVIEDIPKKRETRTASRSNQNQYKKPIITIDIIMYTFNYDSCNQQY